MFYLDSIIFNYISSICETIGNMLYIGKSGGAFLLITFITYAISISNKKKVKK